MDLLFHPDFLLHDTGYHPESAARLEPFLDLPEATIASGKPYLGLVHSKAYIDLVQEACKHGASLDRDTQTSPRSFEVASLAVGAALEAAYSENFALIRPPGHHAYPEKGTGFCLFNNMAIAVQDLVRQGKRVLILDFDGHLGDGTSHCFYHTDKVLFWSFHQYPAFPGFGKPNEIGSGKGKGFTWNVPMPPGSGDDVFWHTFNLLIPSAIEFQADILAISAGFDSHYKDPVLDLNFSSRIYYQLGQTLNAHFPKCFALLEGGYHIEALKEGIYNFQAGVNEDSIPFPKETTTSPQHVWEAFEISLNNLITALSPYWKV